MDLEIRKFEERIISTINQEQLPIEVKRLVLEEVMLKVREASDKEVAAAAREEETAKSKNKKEAEKG